MLIVAIFIWVAERFVFGLITQYVAESKGYDTGFAWGFWLGIIGLLVVGFRPNQERASGASAPLGQDEPSWYASASLGKAEPSGYAPRPVEWTCVCGARNSGNLSYCLQCRRSRGEAEEERVECPHCGARNKKSNAACFACGESLTAEVLPSEEHAPEAAQSETSAQADFAEILRKLAELHAQGVLTDAEFTRKKADILEKI